MSTRTVVKILNGKKCCYLYHHHDGYFEGVGFLLAKIMEKYRDGYSISLDNLVKVLLMNSSFELTFYKHCDIEYYYEANFEKHTVTGWKADNWKSPMKKTCKTDLIKSYHTNPEMDVEIETGLLDKLGIEVKNGRLL